jgi:hypothetical protein
MATPQRDHVFDTVFRLAQNGDHVLDRFAGVGDDSAADNFSPFMAVCPET